MPTPAGRVLIAEDNAALSAVIEFTIKRAGFETMVAPNGAIALDLALASPFDLVISDQQMPRMTGAELLGELRRHEQYADTPMVLLTAKKLEVNLEQLKQDLGVADILPKPFSPNQLAALANDLLAASVG